MVLTQAVVAEDLLDQAALAVAVLVFLAMQLLQRVLPIQVVAEVVLADQVAEMVLVTQAVPVL